MDFKRCFICSSSAKCRRISEGHEFRCDTCGVFVISFALFDLFEEMSMSQDRGNYPLSLIRYLSAYIAEHSSHDKPLVLTTDNWAAFAKSMKDETVDARTDKLLEFVEQRSDYPGHAVELLGARDYPYIRASRLEEFNYLIDYAMQGGYLSCKPGKFADIEVAGCYTATLTPKGIERLHPRTSHQGIPGRCFVAMSFHPSLSDAYELAIEPALKGCGLEARRVDKVPSNEDINDVILAELRDAEMVVADFTLQRNGVYFEAGFARALGREVFWTCREDDLRNLHFDTRQFSFIDWKDVDDLRTRLTNKVRALGRARK
ncbi:MAG TPA: hypothetical protein VJ742_10260 [Nitrososphaera sp.]|nr:hypothetical protein [Nitrososphaera sp.]